jgi:hypothetical protein
MSEYTFLKLNQGSRQFLQSLRSGDADRTAITAMAIARAVNDRLQVPTSAVDNPYEHFEQQMRPQAETLIGQILEVVPFANKQLTSLAVKYTESLYLIQYRIVFPSGRLYASPEAPLASYLGINGFVNMPDHDIMHKNISAIIEQANGFIDVLEELVPLATGSED